MKKYEGKSTLLSHQFFSIGKERMPIRQIYAMARLKRVVARANAALKALDPVKADLIDEVVSEILSGDLDDSFTLSVWQTGSGTQSNMNVNETISLRAKDLNDKVVLHPNDDVNKSQSTNDVFPSAMHIMTYSLGQEVCDMGDVLSAAFCDLADANWEVIKVGRTHLQDATPIRYGQVFKAFHEVIDRHLGRIRAALEDLLVLPLGGSAVGTGLNTPYGYKEVVNQCLLDEFDLPFVCASHSFSYMSHKDSLLAVSGAIADLAMALFKIANDIRLLGSGPRAGYGELLLPANEPGSSIMPGKVNPTQAEALMMICTYIKGLHTSLMMGEASGNFELNVMMPLFAYSLDTGLSLLKEGMVHFCEYCVRGIKVNYPQIEKDIQWTLMVATALTPVLGYDVTTRCVQEAQAKNLSLKEVVVGQGYLSEEAYKKAMDLEGMVEDRG